METKVLESLKSMSGSLSGNLSRAENWSDLQQNKSTDNLVPSAPTNTTTMSTTYSVSPKVSKLRADSKGTLASRNKKLCIYYKPDEIRRQITIITPIATRSNVTPKHSGAKVLSTAESLGLKSVFTPQSSKALGTCETLGSKPMTMCTSNSLLKTPGLLGLQIKTHDVAPVILQTVREPKPQSQMVIQQAMPNATLQSLPILQRQPQATVSTSQGVHVIQSGVSSFQGTQVCLPVLIQKPAEPQPVCV